jgi:MinD superfamily P-loop ATPase
MIIAVGSGKGGTGKTTVATSLALALSSRTPLFMDCDVEAPNAHFILEPSYEHDRVVTLPVPEVDPERCNGCGRCAEVCQYGAILCVDGNVLTFPPMCHGCGSCVSQCPCEALVETPRAIGRLEAGPARDGIRFRRGILDIAEPMAVPVIRALKRWSPSASTDLVIRDLPPGTSCPVVESLLGADAALLVTEPTPFGLHDLRLMIKLVRDLNIPAAVVVNKDGVGDAPVERTCEEGGLPILMRIPLERSLGEALARGRALVDAQPEYLDSLQELFFNLLDLSSDGVHVEGRDSANAPKTRGKDAGVPRLEQGA